MRNLFPWNNFCEESPYFSQEEIPMTTSFDLEACRRLPLANAALRLLAFATDDEFLDGVFQRHRGRSYQNTITFSTFVHLIADALLGHQAPSAHQTFQHACENESLEASVQALYAKLRRVPLELSLAFFTESAARLRSVGSEMVGSTLPKSLDGHWVLGFDGKKIKHVAQRLKPLRDLEGKIYGGKLLVVQDFSTRMAVATEAVADGEAADNPLVPGAVARVRALESKRPRLWVGDRAFCGYKLMGLLSEGGDGFVIRFNRSCDFHLDSQVSPRVGKDDQGRNYREEWGWLGKPGHPNRIRVRRITIEKPGDPLIIVTSLLAADLYPAADLLTLYRKRWGIETMFQQVVQTFNLRHLIGTTPKATVFQAVLCLLLYNATLIIGDFVAQGAKKQANDVSLNLLFDSICRELTGWLEVIGAARTADLLARREFKSAKDLGEYLRDLLGTVWKDRWKKSRTRKRPAKGRKRAYISGGHTSVDKILRGAHKEVAYRLGFAHPPSFFRAFTKATGLTPEQFRVQVASPGSR